MLFRSMNIQSLRTAIGYVQQDVFLFSDSIENNIHFGLKEILNETDLIDAAHTAHVKHEIENLPQAFKTMVGERGTTLSGGQKQRISIARSLLKNPAILIFDDCLSAVDANTEPTIPGAISLSVSDNINSGNQYRTEFVSDLANDISTTGQTSPYINSGTPKYHRINDPSKKQDGYYHPIYVK